MQVAKAIWPPDDLDRSAGPAVAALMKLSFDDSSRQPICDLGKLGRYYPTDTKMRCGKGLSLTQTSCEKVSVNLYCILCN